MTSPNGQHQPRAATTELPVPVRLGLPGGTDIPPDVAALLRHQIATRVAGFGRELGLAITPAVTLTASEADGSGQGVAVVVNGRRCGYPANLPATLEMYLTEPGPSAAAHATLPGWLAEARGPDDPAAGLAAEYLGLLAVQAIEKQPSVLLPAGLPGTGDADRPADAEVRRGLLDLGLWAGEPEQVNAAVRDAPDPAAALERLAAERAVPEWHILVEPGYLRDLSLLAANPGIGLRDVLIGVGYSLGVPVPAFRMKADPALRGGCFRFRINRTCSSPIRGIPVDHVLVPAAAPGQLPGGIPTTECVFGTPSLLLAAEQRQAAAELGLTTWDAGAYLGICLRQAIWRRAGRLIDSARVSAGLDRLAQRRPVQAGLARRQLPLARLTRIMRDLIEECVPVRNLGAILDLLMEYEALGAPGSTGPLGWTRAGLRETIAAEFAPGLHRITVRALSAGAQAMTETWAAPAETDETAGESLLAAIRPELASAPGVPWLVPDEARRAIYLAARREFPDLRVLGRAELPPGVAVEIAQR